MVSSWSSSETLHCSKKSFIIEMGAQQIGGVGGWGGVMVIWGSRVWTTTDSIVIQVLLLDWDPIIDLINNFMRHVFQVNFRSEKKKRKFVVSEQLSFYPFIQGMMDIKVDPFNLKSWLRPFKEWFRVGRERDWWLEYHARAAQERFGPSFCSTKEKRKNQTNLAKYLNNDHIHGQIFWTKKLQNKRTVLEQKLKKDVDAFKKGRRLVAKKLKTHF